MGLLSSVKIIDLTRVFSGPFATKQFADLGAKVIKIEPPGGDDTRHFPPLVGNWSGYFDLLNSSKESVFLDLKKDNDLNYFYDLCKNADVVVENFSPSIKKKLKVDYITIKKINPEIIYASINGVSENIDKKYYDVIAQAESGLVSLNGLEEDMKISTSIVDAFSGMKLAFAVSAALFHKLETGRGQKLSVSMKGSAFDLLEQNLIEASVTRKNPKKVGNMDNAIAPFGIFKTKNGAIALAVGNSKLWQSLLGFLRQSKEDIQVDLYTSNQDRLINIKSLKKDIEFVFEQFNSEELINKLGKLGIPSGCVNTMLDVLNDKENYSEGLLLKVNNPVAGEIVRPSGGIFFNDKDGISRIS